MPTHTRPWLGTVLSLLAAFGLTASLAGQQPRPAGDQPVKQATYDRAAPADAPPPTVRFGRRPARIGDQTEQTLEMEMRLTLNMRRASEIIGKNQTTAHTKQRRIMTIMAVDAGRSTTVRVQYPEATKRVSVKDQGSNVSSPSIKPIDAAGSSNTRPITQSIEGKTYLCRREPGENGMLVITDEAGNRPPKEEFDIVAGQMEMVGRTNPLAEFLVMRPVAIGEKIELPKDLASQLFALGEKFGEVTRFTLTLQKVQAENGSNCAVFLADVEAASNDASQMRLQVEGPFVVQVDTCRAARINLVGPIGMSETRGTYSTAYQVIGTGRLQMSIASIYRETQR